MIPPPAIGVPDGYMAKAHHRLRKRLPVWVIYHPWANAHGRWASRMHVALPQPKATRFTIVHDTLDELRSLLPPGLVKLARHPADVPEIVETWI